MTRLPGPDCRPAPAPACGAPFQATPPLKAAIRDRPVLGSIVDAKFRTTCWVRKLLNRFSQRSIGVFAFCWLRRGESGKVKAKKCKISGSTDVQIDSQPSPLNRAHQGMSLLPDNADFHIFNREFASKVGIPAATPGPALISFTAQNRHALLSVGPHPRRTPPGQGRFVPAVFLLDKTETTDKVRLNRPNF